MGIACLIMEATILSVLIIGHRKILIGNFLYRGTDYKIVKYGLDP